MNTSERPKASLRPSTFARRAVLRPGLVPVAVVLGMWALLPSLDHLPVYKLPHLAQVASELWHLAVTGAIFNALGDSLSRLAIAFVIGATLGVAVGVAVALSRALNDFLMPLIAFFNAIAGIAWIPLAIVWFGFGSGPVLFVIANNVFFIVLYNTLLGAERIPPVMYDAVRTLGGDRRRTIVREVLVPGAMVGVLGGLRTGLAFAWRALVAVEMIAASNGLGFMSIQASRVFDGSTVVSVILVIGTVWVLMDRLLLRPVEALTVRRWGMLGGADL
ncbi:MAG: ABC transporter permease [Actinobacteria bacterium]|nr:ABC transporter permease [Actinomycetota bacterium]